jgi:protein involved in polysaccharide export with SLBB domain
VTGIRFRPRVLVLSVLGLFAWAGGAAGQAAPNAPAVLTPGDALMVRISNLGGELPEYREIVDREGRIELPFLGFLAVAGQSLAAVEAEMAAAYARAKLSTNAVVRLEYVTHFDPPPDRANLVRIEDPRQPALAAPPPLVPAAPESP